MIQIFRIFFIMIMLFLYGCETNPPYEQPVKSLSGTTGDTNLNKPKVSVVSPQENEYAKAKATIERLGNPKSQQKALVIGNRDYDYAPLRNPLNDADKMAQQLEKMDFYVIKGKNLNNQEMQEIVKEFGDLFLNNGKPSNIQGQVALVYYSGHGAQVSGNNYLIPINNNLLDGKEGKNGLDKNAVMATTVLHTMEEGNGQGMNILILDACRDNPYKGRDKNLNRGLNRIAPGQGSMIAFATAPDQTALDGQSGTNQNNGVYTTALLKALEDAEHQRIEDVFMQVQNQVSIMTVNKQIPWYQASLRRPFCFGGCQ